MSTTKTVSHGEWRRKKCTRYLEQEYAAFGFTIHERTKTVSRSGKRDWSGWECKAVSEWGEEFTIKPCDLNGWIQGYKASFSRITVNEHPDTDPLPEEIR